MARLGILNMFIGFMTLFLAACGGTFVAFDLTEGFLRDTSILNTWEMALLKSAHGHTNLFGLLHIAFGLTIPYSPLTERWKFFQTFGIFSGTLAMGPGMMVRAYQGPTESLDLVGCIIGVGLSFALIALFTHSISLAYKLYIRA